MPRPHSRLFVATLLSVALAAACQDALITTPASTSPSPAGVNRRGFSSDPGFGSKNSPENGNYDGTISKWDGGTEPAHVGTFIYPTIITVMTTGTVHQVPGLLNGDQLTWQVEGTSDHQSAMAMIVSSDHGSGIWFTTGSAPQTFSITGYAQAFRTALNDPQPYGEPHWTCGRQFPDHDHPCWSFEGTAHLEFKREPVDLVITRTDTLGVVPKGGTATFTASMDREVINDRVVNMSELAWRFVPEPPVAPDTESVAGDTLGCSSATERGCSRQMQHSGMLYATAYVNGVQVEKSVHVSVRKTPELVLRADRTVIDAGDTVSLTTTAPGSRSLVVQRYYYTEGESPLALRSATGALNVVSPFEPGAFGPVAHSTIASSNSCTRSFADTCIDDPETKGSWHVVASVDGETKEAKVDIVVLPPEATLVCTVQEQGVRGDQVECAFKLKKPKAYTVTRHVSTISDGVLVDEPLNEAQSAGNTHYWFGRALTNTTVRIDARVGTIPVSKTTTFNPAPRSADKWAKPPLPVPGTVYTDDPQLINGSAPGIYRTTASLLPETTAEGSLGMTKFDVSYSPTDGKGPNAGLFMYDDVTVSRSRISLRAALEAGSDFEKHQTGGAVPGYNATYCTAADVQSERDVVERHERSHFAAHKKQFLDVLMPKAETEVFRSASLLTAKARLAELYDQRFRLPLAPVDSGGGGLDGTHADPVLSSGTLPCVFRLPPNWI